MPRKPKSPDELKKRKKLRQSQVEVDLENELDANEVPADDVVDDEREVDNAVDLPDEGNIADDSSPNRNDEADVERQESERRADDSNSDDNRVNSVLPDTSLAEKDSRKDDDGTSKKSKRKRSPKPVDALTARRLFRHQLINR